MQKTAAFDVAVAAPNFVTEEGPKYHKAFGEPSTYDRQRQQFGAYRPSCDLEESLRSYHAGGGTNWHIDHCTWDDVFDELEQAEHEYERAAKGGAPSHIVRKGSRWVGDKASAIAPWIDLIPTSNGMSVLSAGLKLIFSIAREQAGVRQKILAAFGEIPVIITNTALTRELFKSDKVVRDCAIALYETALLCIERLVRKLNGALEHKSRRERAVEHAKRNAKKFLQPSLESEEIDGIVESMRDRVRQFHDSVQRNRDRRDLRTERNAQTTLHEVQATRKVGIDTKIGLNQVNEKVDSLARDNRQFQDNYEQMHSEIERLRAGLAAQNGLLATLLHRSPSPTIMIQNSPCGHHPESFLPGYQLLEALKIDPMTSVRDLECVLRQGGTVNQAEEAQAQQLLQLTRFSAWFWPLESDILLVNGNFDMWSRISPLSYLCAQLALTLNQDSGWIVLHFFCGQHEAGMDPVRGPRGLLRTITTQLLYSGHAFSHGFIDTRDYSNAIRDHAIEELCVTFRLLVSQLPLNQKVLCIVDNISRFEREEWYQDLAYVVEMLYRITEDQSFKPNLKVLMTGGTARTRAELWLPPDKRLLLPKGSPHSYRPISGRTILSDVQARKPSYQEKMAMMADNDSEEDWF